MADLWHFPRPELAASYLTFFDSGISNALLLFAKRRAGKTEFLLQDLAPAAEQAGRRVVYASFWQSPLSPAAVLLYHLERSLQSKSLSERLRQFLAAPVTRLKLSGSLPGVKGEAEVDLSQVRGEAPADLLLYLDDLFARLARSRRRLLLMLDEVQELGIDPGNRSLVAALRTSLDKYRDQVSVVFTGSSREGLTRMFSGREAPFFHFATQIELPALDEAFVRHIVRTYRVLGRRRLDETQAVRAFRTVGSNPYYFRKLIEILLAGGAPDLSGAIAQLRERLPEEQGYARLWIGLRPLDREVLALLAAGERSVFSRPSRARLGERLESPEPDSAAIQNALRRLLSARIILKTDEAGRYLFEDPEFAAWVQRASSMAGLRRRG